MRRCNALAKELREFDWGIRSGSISIQADKGKQYAAMLRNLASLQAEVIDYQDNQLNQEVAALKFQLMVTNWIVMATIVMGLMLWLL